MDSPETKKDPQPVVGIVGIVVVIIAIAFLAWWFSVRQQEEVIPPVETPSIETVLEATESAVAPEVEVPTSVNPIKESLPKETPLEKTNPFNNVYENPFN